MSVKAVANRLGFNVVARAGLEKTKNISAEEITALFSDSGMLNTDLSDWFYVSAVDNDDVPVVLGEVAKLIKNGYSTFGCIVDGSGTSYCIIGFKGTGLKNDFDKKQLVAFINKNETIKECCRKALNKLEIDGDDND